MKTLDLYEKVEYQDSDPEKVKTTLQRNPEVRALMKKHNISATQLYRFLITTDQLSTEEIQDKDYILDRLEAHLSFLV